MMGETMIGAMAVWLGGCPLLAGKRVGVGYLDTTAGGAGRAVAVYDAGAAASRRYLGGDAPVLRRHRFTVRWAEPYGPDNGVNAAGTGLAEALGRWMEDGNSGMPALPGGLAAVRVSATADGGPLANGTQVGSYGLACVLEYLEASSREGA